MNDSELIGNLENLFGQIWAFPDRPRAYCQLFNLAAEIIRDRSKFKRKILMKEAYININNPNGQDYIVGAIRSPLTTSYFASKESDESTKVVSVTRIAIINRVYIGATKKDKNGDTIQE
tara:strand:- start:344 stop:700 length:357 start_codon:yes stop_codon:yes gene_type:complete